MAISASCLPPQTCLDHCCTTVYGWHCPWDMLHTLPRGLLLQERFWCPSSRTQSPLSPDSGWRGLDRSHLAGKRGWAFKTPHVNFLNHTAWPGCQSPLKSHTFPGFAMKIASLKRRKLEKSSRFSSQYGQKIGQSKRNKTLGKICSLRPQQEKSLALSCSSEWLRKVTDSWPPWVKYTVYWETHYSCHTLDRSVPTPPSATE